MTLIYFILILGITVFIHEFGHFIFAKKAGVHIYEFSIGMGPKLFSKIGKNDGITYSLRLIPLGGYVQMAGEEVEIDKDIPVEKRMQSKTWFQRFMILFAGPMMNFILAIILLFVMGLIYGVTETTPIVGEVVKNSPFYENGIIEGSIIKSINGTKVKNYDDILLELELIEKGQPAKFVVEYNGEETTYNLKRKEIDGEYIYGFTSHTTTSRKFGDVVKYTFTKFISLIKTMVVVFKSLFTGALGLDSLSGPVGIYTVIGESASAGFQNVLYILAFISLNVGFVNLIPFPAFDGGRILFLIIEGVMRKPLNPKIENAIHNIGFILLLVLMIYVTIQDIFRFF